MNKYLTTKLAEEGSEVAQAACKVLLHQDKRARQELRSEMADLQAMLNLAHERMTLDEQSEFRRMVTARMARERKKGKA